MCHWGPDIYPLWLCFSPSSKPHPGGERQVRASLFSIQYFLWNVLLSPSGRAAMAPWSAWVCLFRWVGCVQFRTPISMTSRPVAFGRSRRGAPCCHSYSLLSPPHPSLWVLTEDFNKEVITFHWDLDGEERRTEICYYLGLILMTLSKLSTSIAVFLKNVLPEDQTQNHLLQDPSSQTSW